MAPDDRSLEQRSDGHRHEWTTFEFDIMLSLICKGTHLHGIVEFATKFNEGLNGAGYSGHRRDVDMEDIQEILLYILDKKKAAVAFIERQHMPRVTRAQKRVFMRSISFTGTLKEWKVDGRKDEEALEHPNRVRQMVERQQKEQFLRDFERHVEQQDMQRGHQRLAGELVDERATRDERLGSSKPDEFRFVSRGSPEMPAAVNRRDGLDASANMLDPRAPTYSSNNATQHGESTSVVPASTRDASRLSEVDDHVQGNNIHETQLGWSMDTGLSDVSHSLSTTTNPLLDATYHRGHARDLLRPDQEQGQGLSPRTSSATRKADMSWHGAFPETHPPKSPKLQPPSQSVSGSRQPCFETSGRHPSMAGIGLVADQIGSVGASMSREYDRQNSLGMLPKNVENDPATQPLLATQFADLQAQPSNQESTYRNNSRKENLPPRDSRNRAQQ